MRLQTGSKRLNDSLQVAKATLTDGADQSFSQEKVLSVDKYEVV